MDTETLDQNGEKVSTGKTGGAKAISRIEVERLFGTINYILPPSKDADLDFSHLFVLYGENGSGKTTILRLLFNLMYPVSGQGRKSQIARTPFKAFRVELNDGTKLSAARGGDSLVGDYEISVQKIGEEPRTLQVITAPDQSVQTGLNPELDTYLRQFMNFGIDLYFIPDDRRVSTTIARDIHVTSEVVSVETPEGPVRHVVRRNREEEEERGHLDVGRAVQDVSNWIRQQILKASRIGEARSNTIYVNLVAALSSNKPKRPGPKPRRQMIEELQSLSERNKVFSKFGFTGSMPVDKLTQAIETAGPDTINSILEILGPYISSVETRLRVLADIEKTVSNLVAILSSFFSSRKKVSYHLQHGLRIDAESGKRILPHQLSSGEKQLLFIICNVVLSKDRPSLFIIDEPEISLNVRWQRKLLSTLLELTRDSHIQFVLATHSMEILARHRQSIAILDSQGSDKQGEKA